MKPIDYRNITWQQLQQSIVRLRRRVYEAYLLHGPGTTEQIAQRSGISILNVRPRTTELYQMGFLVLVDQPASAVRGRSDGVYRALTMAEAQQTFEQRKLQESQNEQLGLGLKV